MMCFNSMILPQMLYISLLQYHLVWCGSVFKETKQNILQYTHKATSVLTGSVVCQGGIWQHFLIFFWAVGRMWYLLNAERKSSLCLFCCKIFWCGSLKLRNQRSWKTENLCNLLFQCCLCSKRETHRKTKWLLRKGRVIWLEGHFWKWWLKILLI